MPQILDIAGQIELFRGCVYSGAESKVILPSGVRLGRSRFNVEYGGHIFALNHDGKRTTSSAWRAFTRNEAYRPPIERPF